MIERKPRAATVRTYIVSVWLIGLFVWDATVLDGFWNAEFAYCETNFVQQQRSHVWVVCVTIFFDVCIQAMTLALFLYPLMELRAKLRQSDVITDRERADELSQVMVHYSNLAVKMAASSCVCLPLAAYLNMGLILLMDNVLKSVCAVLYFMELHKGLYRALCCCDRLCLTLTITTTSDEKNVAREISNDIESQRGAGTGKPPMPVTQSHRELDLIVMRLESPLELID